MRRHPEREQINRLMVKTLDQVFIARAREGLSCSLFEAQTLTELVKEVYFTYYILAHLPPPDKDSCGAPAQIGERGGLFCTKADN